VDQTITTQSNAPLQRKLALILPAHDEEMVIAATVRSALAAGQDPQDIFVVSDGSLDTTVLIALVHLPWYQRLRSASGRQGHGHLQRH